jgi:cytoskeletal protein RodZ
MQLPIGNQLEVRASKKKTNQGRIVMMSKAMLGATAIVFMAVSVWGSHAAVAQDKATATRPAKEPQSQTSVPSTAPAATTTQTTGATDQSPTVKQMNKVEGEKVKTEGK